MQLLMIGIVLLGLNAYKKKKAATTDTPAVESSGQEDRLPDGIPALKAGWEDLVFSVLGKPYVWGAEGPDSFDCSGLAWYLLDKQGKKTTRTTADGMAKAASWTQDKIRAGDLLFYGKDGVATHVTTAVSDEQSDGRVAVLSASGTKANGGVVKLYDRAAYRSDYLGHGRI